MSDDLKNEIKSWITPGLVTIFWVVSWSAWGEMRSDMKKLLEANAQAEYRMPALETRVEIVESKVEYIQNKISVGTIQSHGR